MERAARSQGLTLAPPARSLVQQYHDPITFKVFNDHTAIAAIQTTGNVYARESVDRLNLKPNNLHDVRRVAGNTSRA